jgi:hypothetical protein
MTLADAQALAQRINQQPKRGWRAAPKLILVPSDEGTYDGKWYAVLEHPRARFAYPLASFEEYQQWRADGRRQRGKAA